MVGGEGGCVVGDAVGGVVVLGAKEVAPPQSARLTPLQKDSKPVTNHLHMRATI